MREVLASVLTMKQDNLAIEIFFFYCHDDKPGWPTRELVLCRRLQ